MPEDLNIRALRAGYGAGWAVQGADLVVPGGQVTALLGRNGAGKSSTLLSVMGLLPRIEGSITVGDAELVGKRTHTIARAGVALVPQGRRMFAGLTVMETLRVCARGDSRRRRAEIGSVLERMPRLHERSDVASGQLSGGEQQMLSIARALLTQPRVLLLDEPSDGLAPAVVAQVREEIRALCSTGLTVLLVEQDLRTAFELAAHVHVMDKGRVVHSGPMAEFRSQPERARELLGVGS